MMTLQKSEQNFWTFLLVIFSQTTFFLFYATSLFSPRWPNFAPFLRFCFCSAPNRYDSNASASDSSEEGNESEDEAAKKKKAKKTKVVKEKKERKPRKEVANEIWIYIWF